MEEYNIKNNNQQQKNCQDNNQEIINQTSHNLYQQQNFFEQKFNQSKKSNQFLNKHFIKITNDIPENEFLTENNIKFLNQSHFNQQQFKSVNIEQVVLSPPPLPPKKINKVINYSASAKTTLQQKNINGKIFKIVLKFCLN